MTELKKFAKEFSTQHPELKSQVEDLVQLCEDEIAEGGSPAHEISLCIESIKQLLEE